MQTSMLPTHMLTQPWTHHARQMRCSPSRTGLACLHAPKKQNLPAYGNADLAWQTMLVAVQQAGVLKGCLYVTVNAGRCSLCTALALLLPAVCMAADLAQLEHPMLHHLCSTCAGIAQEPPPRAPAVREAVHGRSLPIALC